MEETFKDVSITPPPLLRCGLHSDLLPKNAVWKWGAVTSELRNLASIAVSQVIVVNSNSTDSD